MEIDLAQAITWAEAERRPWAFSLVNAAAGYAEFRNRWDNLGELNWPAIASTDFRDAAIKDGKQAEFPAHGTFPTALIERIGVHNEVVQTQVRGLLATASIQPTIEVRRDWYY